jgi:hypothetical protein
MTKYIVEFKGVAWATATVEAEDESEAIEAAFEDGFPGLCAQCSGWNKPWTLSIPDDPAAWELDAESVRSADPDAGE